MNHSIFLKETVKREPMFTIGQEKSQCNRRESQEDRTFSLGSIHSLDGTSDTQPLSPLERVGKSLTCNKHVGLKALCNKQFGFKALVISKSFISFLIGCDGFNNNFLICNR
jgi:hypothetical protein